MHCLNELYYDLTGGIVNIWTAKEGSPYPCGVTWIVEEQAYNFALYSKHATGVTLLLYSDEELVHPIYLYKLDYLKNKSGRIWHCRIAAEVVDTAKYYGYVLEGPFEPAEGHRFDPQKILLDPYAKAVFFPATFNREAARLPGSNAGQAPLGVIHKDRTPSSWGDDKQPRHTFDTVIYEVHVKGFTRRHNSKVSAEKRGTYSGIVEKIPYLKELGVTVVELLPVFQHDPQEGNYWGYLPLSFFSPHHAYASSTDPDGQINEFKNMVKALHRANIEVILDVVYNHTAEGNQNGPTYSFRGIDNSTYYLLSEDKRWYRNDAGVGNVLHCNNRYVRKMIIDSLIFWVREMHIDGFRFDLASIFTRKDDGSINLDDPPVISEISAHPDLANVRLIAEAWDISSYQLGRSFPGITWLQWNAKFRDDVRSFIKGDPDKVGSLMTRLYGSDDLFPDDLSNAYHAYQSVNLITSHDGFCLYDLVSYNAKHNEANGHNNKDGTDSNLSWNCGHEGDTDLPPEVMELRKRQIKNFCCILFLSNGTPMFCAGDEFMNTQRGNNNPYNQDNETTWLNWDLLEENQDIFRFFKGMIAFRKAHPALGRSRYWRDDIRWYGTDGQVDLSRNSQSLAFCLNGASQQDNDIYVMINAFQQDLGYSIQEGQAREWKRVVDTSLPSPSDFLEPGQEEVLHNLNYTVKARSVVMLLKSNDLKRK
jgi:isoamylase